MPHSTVRDPWLSIWRQPRETIREAIEIHSSKHDTHLAMVAGIAHMLAWASEKDLAPRFSLVEILLICLIAGPVYGYNFYMFLHFPCGRQVGFSVARVNLMKLKRP